MIKLTKIAHIGSTQGKSGALKFFPEEHIEDKLNQLDFIFLKINGSKVPFKVKKINQDHDPWLLFIDKIEGPEKAQQFTNSEVFVESDKVGIQEIVVEKTMEGFTIKSKDGKSFGVVKTVEEHPQQILLLVEFNDGEFRIPFHPDLVHDLDKENGIVTFTYSKEDLDILFS